MKASYLAALIASPLVIIGTIGGIYIHGMEPQLELGVGYAARVACGCRFIEGRPLAQCPADFEAGMEEIRLAEDDTARSITASVPLIAARTVRYDSVLGCQPEPFRGTAYTVR